MRIKNKTLKAVLIKVIVCIPVIGTYYKFRCTRNHNRSFWGYLCFLLRRDKTIFWPRSSKNKVTNPKSIVIGMNSTIGGDGCYIQGNGRLIIGNYVLLSLNIGVLSGNHNVYNQNEDIGKTTIIGDYSWIGMNSIILPGVVLGPRTVVGAGSVVTKSFPEGYCIIGGNPAVKLKDIDRERFVPTRSKYDFYGYVPAEKFEKFKRKHLKHYE